MEPVDDAIALNVGELTPLVMIALIPFTPALQAGKVAMVNCVVSGPIAMFDEVLSKERGAVTLPPSAKFDTLP